MYIYVNPRALVHDTISPAYISDIKFRGKDKGMELVGYSRGGG